MGTEAGWRTAGTEPAGRGLEDTAPKRTEEQTLRA